MSTIGSPGFDKKPPTPGLLVAFAPVGSYTVDRCLIGGSFVVGRSADCDLSVRDSKISGKHFAIGREEGRFWIEDRRSTNGTFVNGLALSGRTVLKSPSVIRAGRAVFVYYRDAGQLVRTPPAERYGMAGRFHVGSLIENLKETALSSRHVLLTGESGTGKELAASALARLMSREGKPLKLIAHNAARTSSQEEAQATLFGVTENFFSNVDARPGLIEQAHGGALFIDEVHNLPEHIQRSLLRVIEDGQTSRLGESAPKPAAVRFIFASNAEGPTKGLAHDLFARLRLVELEPLSERVGDIPSIFDSVLLGALRVHSIADEEVLQILTADHYEAMCLGDYRTENVRGLIDLADRLATRIAAGSSPEGAVSEVFADKFGDGLVAMRKSGGADDSGASHYEQNKHLIVSIYRECDFNLSATERRLKSLGLRCSRRWLSEFLDKWGEKK